MATKRTLPLAALQQQLTLLFGDGPHVLAGPFEHWLTTSKPFVSFTQSYQQKIRKKVRMSRDDEELTNLYCELRTAFLLLQEPKFAVEYEPYAIQQGRSPDFAVTYRTHTRFHVEVTRLRPARQEQQRSEQEINGGNDSPAESTILLRRLADVVGDKVTQLSPSGPNVLWVWVQSRMMHELEIEPLILALKRKAEQRDAEMLARYSFRNPADFMRHYQRLSLVLVQSLQAQEAEKTLLLWENRDARYPLPAALRDRLYTLVTMDNSQSFLGSGGE